MLTAFTDRPKKKTTQEGGFGPLPAISGRKHGTIGTADVEREMMAKTVYTAEEYELSDGQVVKAAPLPISKLKKAMAFFNDTEEISTVEDTYDFLLGVVEICLDGQLPEEYNLEDSLDVETGKRIVAVCTGIDLDDPNLVMAAAAAGSAGQTST